MKATRRIRCWVVAGGLGAALLMIGLPTMEWAFAATPGTTVATAIVLPGGQDRDGRRHRRVRYIAKKFPGWKQGTQSAARPGTARIATRLS